MLRYKIHDKHLSKELVNRFLSLIEPDKYEMSFIQEEQSFAALKENANNFPALTKLINLEFKTGLSDKLLELFYNEKITNMTLASHYYQVDYSYDKEFHIYLQSKTSSAADAKNDMVKTLELLRKEGLHLGFKDEHHTDEVMELFFKSNFYDLAKEKWHCQLESQETMIRPGFLRKIITDTEGRNHSVTAQVNFEILRLSRILGPRKVDTYLKPLFNVLNNNKEYTVYIRQLPDLHNLELPSSTLFKQSCTFVASPDNVWNFLRGDSFLAVRSLKWTPTIPFNWVSLYCKRDVISSIEIVFEDEGQQELLLSQLNHDVDWEELDIDV